MKKILLIGALAIASIANAANTKVPQKTNVGSEAEKINKEVLPFEWKDASTLLRERQEFYAKAASQYDWADHYYVPYSFHAGMMEGFISGSTAFTIVPFMDSVVYKNYYGKTNWSVNGNEVATDTDTYVTGYDMNGIYYLPETSDHEFNPYQEWGEGYKDTTLHLKGTKYGLTAGASYAVCAPSAEWFSDGASLHMTLCAMECDTLDDTGDFYMVGNSKGTGDAYLNGTGVHLHKGDAATADTLGILVDNYGVMKINQIVMPIYNSNKSANLIPDGAVLRLAIFPLTETGVDFSDTLAYSVMTNADYVNGGAGYEWLGTLQAKFYDIDIFGSRTQVPVWIYGSFYVQLTNFNETGCDFGFFSDFNNPVTATTVYQHNGKFSFHGRSDAGGGQYGQNLGVSFDGYLPTLVLGEDSNILYAPEEGGYAYHHHPDTVGTVFYTNVDPEGNWDFEVSEDWVHVAAIDTSYYSKYGALIFAFEADALPEGVTSRSASIKIIADHAVQTLIFYQGVGQGIENTKANAIFDDKNYDVLGREIKDQNFKGVVIRNGQKKLVK